MRICSEVDVLVKGKIVKNNKCGTQSNDEKKPSSSTVVTLDCRCSDEIMRVVRVSIFRTYLIDVG